MDIFTVRKMKIVMIILYYRAYNLHTNHIFLMFSLFYLCDKIKITIKVEELEVKRNSKVLDEQQIAIKRKKQRIFRENLTLTMLVLPAVICILVFDLIPIPGNLVAFKKYVPRLGIFGSEWNGFESFKFIFQTQDLWRILRNTILYSVWFLVVDFVMGPLYALLMYHLKSRRAGNVYKTIMQIPRFLSYVIVSYITYSFLSSTYGILNQVIEAVGGEGINWYQRAEFWPFILTLVRHWMGIGGGFLLYYSVLLGIDENLFEAAILDGANTWQKCRYIAIPAMMPLLCMNLIFGVGSVLNSNMELHYNIPGNSGYLYETTDVISTYVYRGLMSGDFSRSAAVGLMTSAVGLVLLVSANAIVRKLSPENAIF